MCLLNLADGQPPFKYRQLQFQLLLLFSRIVSLRLSFCASEASASDISKARPGGGSLPSKARQTHYRVRNLSRQSICNWAAMRRNAKAVHSQMLLPLPIVPAGELDALTHAFWILLAAAIERTTITNTTNDLYPSRHFMKASRDQYATTTAISHPLQNRQFRLNT
jgi:hypothetical protein